MIKLSVVIITYNEENNIERCLQSAKEIADEIIVLDSFSTDNTKKICESYNVKFSQHNFDGHIEQKNRAVSLAENMYVLSLDADEMLSEKLTDSILEIKQNPEFDAYYCNRLNIYCGKEIKHGNWYPDRKIRIWNKNLGVWGGENPHDTVILEKGARKRFIQGDILHYSFNSIQEHIDQINKFSKIKAESAFYKGKKTNFFKIYFKPIIKFISGYIVKFGFLDGYFGYVISRNSAFSEFLKQIKIKELQHNE